MYFCSVGRTSLSPQSKMNDPWFIKWVPMKSFRFEISFPFLKLGKTGLTISIWSENTSIPFKNIHSDINGKYLLSHYTPNIQVRYTYLKATVNACRKAKTFKKWVWYRNALIWMLYKEKRFLVQDGLWVVRFKPDLKVRGDLNGGDVLHFHVRCSRRWS